MKFNVRQIEREQTKDFILKQHYARRMPPISKAYGLYDGEEIIGVLTIGKPASPSLCRGIMGEGHSSKVFELNRLITVEGLPRNTLSWFVGRVLRLLGDEDLILVSYADEGMNHCGYIYQATNWIYKGKTRQRTDKYSPPNTHSRHATNDFPHLRKVRTSKHRYVYFTNRRKSEKYKKLLNYPIEPYPKGRNVNYRVGVDRLKEKIINRKTGEVFYQ